MRPPAQARPRTRGRTARRRLSPTRPHPADFKFQVSSFKFFFPPGGRLRRLAVREDIAIGGTSYTSPKLSRREQTSTAANNYGDSCNSSLRTRRAAPSDGGRPPGPPRRPRAESAEATPGQTGALVCQRRSWVVRAARWPRAGTSRCPYQLMRPGAASRSARALQNGRAPDPACAARLPAQLCCLGHVVILSTLTKCQIRKSQNCNSLNKISPALGEAVNHHHETTNS